MCEWGTDETVRVLDARSVREGVYREVPVDACIAPIVKALADAGIATVGSCCGHGRGTGSILLADERVLEVHPDRAEWLRDPDHYVYAGPGSE